MNIDGHLAIAKETCRVIDMGTLILTTETFQLMKPTRLVVALVSLWRVVTASRVYILSTTSRLFRSRGLYWGARPGGSTGRLDRSIFVSASPGSVVRRQRWDSLSAGHRPRWRPLAQRCGRPLEWCRG